MRYLYSFLLHCVALFLPFFALFFSKKSKIRLFIKGRKNVFKNLIPLQFQKVIWIHCASLGEFEQGRPLIETLKQNYSEYKILLTFFSPSGYQIQKNYQFADLVTYLPLDTPFLVKKFLKIAKPHLAIFVKYEFWVNYLYFLHKRKIPTLLIAAIFRKQQFLFTFWGRWISHYLKAFHHCFVQNEFSKKLLQSIGHKKITVCGDTRFDRVESLLKQKRTLPFLASFKNRKTLLVAGSTWKKDESYLLTYINIFMNPAEKMLIAPHNIHKQNIRKLQKNILKKSILFSDIKNNQDLRDFSVLILDTVGLLGDAYAYADFAYVGGGYTSDGIHNILEPAAYGIPIVIGKNYQKFQEAVALCNLKGCDVTNNAQSLCRILKKLYENPKKRKTQGKICRDYVVQNLGATEMILKYIKNCL